MSEQKEASQVQKAIIPLGSRGIELSTFDELYRFSRFVVDAGLAPKSIDTAEKVFLAIQYSMEMGFTPMVGLQNCMVVNNRVSFFGELVAAQVQAHPEFEDMTVVYSGGPGPTLTCTVTIIRKGYTPSVGSYSLEEAKHLTSDPSKAGTWGKYPRRMLFWRAFSRAKIIFSDALKGIKMPSDLEDEDAQPANVLSVTKPEFQNEKTNANANTVDGVQGAVEPDRAMQGSGEPDVAGAEEEDAGRVKGTDQGSGNADDAGVPGNSETGEPPIEPKAQGSARAVRLLTLINKDGFSQVQVIDLLAAFGADVGESRESGVVADIPEPTLSAALQQWETIKFNLAK